MILSLGADYKVLLTIQYQTIHFNIMYIISLTIRNENNVIVTRFIIYVMGTYISI